MPRVVFVLWFFFFLSPVQSVADSPVSANDLVALNDIGGYAYSAFAVSPNGRYVAFQLQTPEIVKGDYRLTWVSIETDASNVSNNIADGGSIILNPSLSPRPSGSRMPVPVQWSPNSERFAYLLKRDGGVQIFVSRPNREGQRKLTSSVGNVIDFRWSKDGSKIFLEMGEDNSRVASQLREEGRNGFLFDERFEAVLSRKPFQKNCVTGRILSLLKPCETSVRIYEIESGKERLATAEEMDAYANLKDGTPKPKELDDRTITRLRRSSDRNQYAWLENENPERFVGPYAPMRMHALIDGELYRCTQDFCLGHISAEHEEHWWRSHEAEVVFLRRDGASRSRIGLYGWKPATGETRRILQTDDWLSGCELETDRLICIYETWTQPRRIVSISLENGAVTTLFDPNPAFLDHQFSRIEKLEWEDAFGNATHGHLVYPIDYQPGQIYPLVIVTYQSRGFLRGGVGDEYPIHPLAAEGFFVLSQEMPLNIMGIAQRSDFNEFLFDDLYWRKATLSSQELIVEALVARGLVDTNRVAITGLSEGEAQTTYALSHSNAFAAAIASGAAFNTSSHYLSSDFNRARWRNMLNGKPEDPASYWGEISIGLRADKVDVPLLINVSDEELLYAVENYTRLKEAGKATEMYVYPFEFHIKWRPDHRLAIYRRNIQWLKFWLMGEEDDDPVSPGQYDRWRTMRDERCAKNEPEIEKPSYCSYH